MRSTSRIGRPLFALLVACAASAPARASVSDTDVLLASNGAAVTIVQSSNVSTNDFQSLIDPSYADALSGLDTLSTNSASNTNLGDSLSASFTTEAALKLTSAAVGSISFSGSTSASASGSNPLFLSLAESLLLSAAYDFNTTSAEVLTLTYSSKTSVSIPDAWNFSVFTGAFSVFNQQLSSTSSGRIVVDLPNAGQYSLGVTLPANTFPDEARVGGGPGGSASGFDSATFDFTIAPTAVPEPATWATMLLGFAGLAFAGYGKSRKSAALAA
jgi:hypothetical protein